MFLIKHRCSCPRPGAQGSAAHGCLPSAEASKRGPRRREHPKAGDIPAARTLARGVVNGRAKEFAGEAVLISV